MAAACLLALPRLLNAIRQHGGYMTPLIRRRKEQDRHFEKPVTLSYLEIAHHLQYLIRSTHQVRATLCQCYM